MKWGKVTRIKQIKGYEIARLMNFTNKRYFNSWDIHIKPDSDLKYEGNSKIRMEASNLIIYCLFIFTHPAKEAGSQRDNYAALYCFYCILR